mmetsp:Transcript_68802/g.174842  ORF Transcript_68802/g.174842 Transcript_68802/m.174842 type:complete len:366 (+) Transcript_68802:117-1214(+)|eukprot:CAMPEP_0183397184 /NCGR_PEP_ID=MMETSP0370-20130417/10427_1 /TAXON_ID=268820 /ORGANISM="Peridinium aciculiferum, Strain PAER-2" /LENGTH=365 /DNA_ID=CAMNT_0025578029 /DNA_START=100 /DNA_END=1197 /DNA_ORIENTATION=+
MAFAAGSAAYSSGCVVLLAALLAVCSDGVAVKRAERLGFDVSKPMKCPGNCAAHGSCDARSGFCWCDAGFGGHDCEQEMPDMLNITALGPPEWAEALGAYKVSPMYLEEGAGADASVKLISYEEATNGWVISEFGSPCADDVCFFGYQKVKGHPPKKGWVYGAPDFQVYYREMVFDDHEQDPNTTAGFHMSVEYTPDINVLNIPDLTPLNGRYVLQPRYVHAASGKFAIMPIDYKAERTWVLAGLMGVPRKWQILMKSTGALYKMHEPPTTEGTKIWNPLEKGMQLDVSCANNFPDTACAALQGQCGISEVATQWIRDCCRAACGSCELSRTACTMTSPKPSAASLLALNETSAPRQSHLRQGAR